MSTGTSGSGGDRMGVSSFFVRLAVLALAPVAACAAEPDSPGIKWSVDRQSVMVGGCVTISIDTNGLNTDEVVAYLDGEQVSKLAFLGPYVRAEGKTHVLVCRRPSRLCPSPGNPEGQRLCPLFGEPGSVELRLEGGRVAPGSVGIEVREIAEEAKPALDLLFPEVFPKAEDQDERVRWGTLLARTAGTTFGNRVLKRSYPPAELEAIVRHPDWAGVMPSVDAVRQYEVARQECFRCLHDKQAVPEEKTRSTKVLEARRDHLRTIRPDSAYARALLTIAESRIASDETQRQALERHR